MRRKDVFLGVMAVLVCLGGTAIAQEQVYQGAGSGFQSSSGLVGGAEMLFLRAYSNTYDQVASWISHGAGATPSNRHELSPRLWLGYVGESGFGVRGRWFQYQHTLNAGTGTVVGEDFFFGLGGFADGFADGFVGENQWDVIEGTYELEMRNYLDVYAVDVDFMQRVDLGCWQANVGGGLRVGGVKRRTSGELLVEADQDEEASYGAALLTRFEGVGPTIFAELKRPILGTGFSLVANARGSLLFGDRAVWISAHEEGEGFSEELLSSDGVVTVGEIQLGAEYARQLGYGTIGFAQLLWEGQIWSNASHVAVLSDDLGLTGVAFNFGITR